jgi:zinc/manganese transport system substrate-binding protein
MPLHTRRTLTLLLALIVTAPAQAALRVFACEPEWAALASEIGGEQVTVYTATNAHQDPHHVDARPSLIAQVRKADIVVCTGAGLEVGWLPVLLTRSANPALKNERLFFAAEQVQRLGPQGVAVDRSKGDVHGEGNPHVHLDPRRVMQIGDALAQRFAQLDAAHAALYTQRAAAFRSTLTAALAKADLSALTQKRYFVYHDAWPYLIDWIGAQQAGTVEPFPGVPPSGKHLATLAAQAKSQRVDAVLHTTYDDRQAVQWLGRNAGVCAIELPYTVGGSPQATTLTAFFTGIIARLDKGC